MFDTWYYCPGATTPEDARAYFLRHHWQALRGATSARIIDTKGSTAIDVEAEMGPCEAREAKRLAKEKRAYDLAELKRLISLYGVPKESK